MSAPPYKIDPVRTSSDVVAIAGLFRAYVDALRIDLAYQGFEGELASLPGVYAPPRGELLLARDVNGQPAGCVGLRPLSTEVCEMKRLYIHPGGRGLGLGKALVASVIETATQLGYEEMRLDTLPEMNAAIRLYRKAGFGTISAYYETPLEQTIFMSRRLDPYAR